MNNRTAYTNAVIYTGNGKQTGKAILVKNNIIEAVVSSEAVPAGYTTIDLNSLNIAPAFIDLQIYGADGKLFSAYTSPDAIAATYEYCIQGGCSHFMITLATNTIEKFIEGIEAVRLYRQQGGKGVLGLHLEGPYLNPVKKGAHMEACIKKPTLQEVEMLLNRGEGIVKMMTLAPEMCDDEIIRLLINRGIIVSAGHSNATYRQAKKGFALGIPAATHLFNAMSAFQSREPGLVGAVYDDAGVKASIVADGIHVDFVSLKISKKLMGDRLFFITDAVTGNSKGEYMHEFKGDRYTLPDGTLSGSSLTMMQAVKNVTTHAGIPLEEALRMASAYPASLLEAQPPLGKIEKGYAADFVVFDNELEVKEVITA
ncbi:MAG: N-acetylglucosamine-6-phosphate deacetylase [Chitinophagaceae bacterium]|nr:N-acetylglucosamine-6-phosphate deacetylase [Chitinophagaceae bacterium]